MPRKSIARAVDRYSHNYDKTVASTDTFVRDITDIIDDAGINYLAIEGRAKTPASFAAKLTRRVQEYGPDFDAATQITDQVGVRIVTYVQSDIAPVAQLLMDNFAVLEDRDMGQVTASEGRFGYQSRHMLISRDRDASEYNPATCASVQLRTVLQHAWAEFEHDARYKGNVPPEYVSDLDRRFTLAAGLLELADREFSIIRDTLKTGGHIESFATDTDRIPPTDLASFLAGRYDESGFSRSDHYVQAAGLLTELGVVTLEDLRQELSQVDSDIVERAMGYRRRGGPVALRATGLGAPRQGAAPQLSCRCAALVSRPGADAPRRAELFPSFLPSLCYV